MKKYFSFLSMLMLTVCLFGITSCIKDSDTNNTLSLNGTFTITGSYPQYVLVGDNGNRVFLTVESVSNLTNGKGFGDAKRLHALIVYNEKDLVEQPNSRYNINNAELRSAAYISVNKVCTIEEATDKKINLPDSVFEMNTLNAWVANGYLTTNVLANYSAVGTNPVVPSVNLMLEETKTDEVTFQVLYNRHTSKNVYAAGSSYFLHSFVISDLDIPGSDSIKVNVKGQGCSTATIKVPRATVQNRL